jgi:hypothetical protein
MDVYPCLTYRDLEAALAFLERPSAWSRRSSAPTSTERVATQRCGMARDWYCSSRTCPTSCMEPSSARGWVYVAVTEPDSHFERAKAAGGSLTTGRLAGALGLAGAVLGRLLQRPAGPAVSRRPGALPWQGRGRPRATAGWVEVGRPNIAQQCLDLGLLNQVRVDPVPMLLGEDIPFFDHLSTAPVALEGPSVIEAPASPIASTRGCPCSGRTGRPRGGRGHRRLRPNTMPPPQQSSGQ